MVVFVVVGRLGKTLTLSKILPIVSCQNVTGIYVFREEKGIETSGVCYVTLPSILASIQPPILKKLIRHIVEPIQILIYAMRLRPEFINGFFTLPKGLYSAIIARIVGAQSIVSIIGGEREIANRYLPFPNFWLQINLILLRFCNIVTTKGQRDNQYLEDHGIPMDKIFVFNGSIDTSIFFPDENVTKDIDILFVGQFSERKGPDRVVEIVRKLRNSGKHTKCAFLGEGALFQKIEEQIHSASLEEQIELVGYVDDTSLYYQRSKLLIMPSSSEGLATAMLEAMACGCVPIVSNVDNLTEAAIHNETAMVVDDYFDIEKFARYAQDLLDDNHKRITMSRKATELVIVNYSILAQTSVYENILAFGQNDNEY